MNESQIFPLNSIPQLSTLYHQVVNFSPLLFQRLLKKQIRDNSKLSHEEKTHLMDQLETSKEELLAIIVFTVIFVLRTFDNSFCKFHCFDRFYSTTNFQ